MTTNDETVGLVSAAGTRVTVPTRMAGLLPGYVKADPEESPSASWTVARLRDWSNSHGIDLDGATTKADILAAIELAEE